MEVVEALGAERSKGERFLKEAMGNVKEHENELLRLWEVLGETRQELQEARRREEEGRALVEASGLVSEALAVCEQGLKDKSVSGNFVTTCDDDDLFGLCNMTLAKSRRQFGAPLTTSFRLVPGRV